MRYDSWTHGAALPPVGNVRAEVVRGVNARHLQPIIERRVRKGATVVSDGWKAYTGIATKGYVQRLVDHGRERLPLYRGEYVWRYNHRRLSVPECVSRLLPALLRDSWVSDIGL